MKLSRPRAYINPTPVPKMPTGLVELMEGLSREVIKNNPSDIFNFCADHMSMLLELRDGRPPKKCLNLEQKINVANNIIKQRAEQRREKYDKNMEMYTRQNNLTDGKSYEKSIAEPEYHHADKSSEVAESKIMQTDENIKSEDSMCNNSETNSSKMEFSCENLKENEVSQAAVVECDINTMEIKSNDNIEGADSVKILSIETNVNVLPDNKKNMGDLTTADVNPKDGNKMELSKQDDTSVFANIIDKNVNINFGNNIDLDNKFNHEVYVPPNTESKINTDIDKIMNFEVFSNNTDISAISNIKTWAKTAEEIKVNEGSNVVHEESLDIKQDEYNDTSIRPDNNIINDNLKQNTTSANVEEGTKIVSTNKVHDEITYDDTKTDEIKSNNMNSSFKNVEEVNAVTANERGDDTVSSEEAPKNYLNGVQCNKEVHDVTVTEQANDYVPTEEALKNNLIVQCNEEVHDVTVTEQADDYVPSEEALKNNLIAQSNEEVYDVIVTEPVDGYVPREEAQKNFLVEQYNEEVNNIAVTKQADEYVLSEEELKINGIVQCSEEVRNTTDTEQAVGYVSSDEAPKNNHIVQSKTEKIEEDNEKNIQHKECNIVEENYIKCDLLGTNTVSSLKYKEELSIQNVQSFDVSNSSLTNNDEHHHDSATSNKQLNEEHKSNELSNEELKVEPFIKNCQNINDPDVKEAFFQNNINGENYSTNDEYNNNKQELEATDTNNVSPMDLERAAITIQKVFRNFLFRSKTSFDDSGKTEFNEFERDAETKNEDSLANHNQNVNKERRAVGINRMDSVLQTVNEEKSLSLSTDDSSTVSSAATVIQAHVRGFLVRNRLNRDKTISNASLADCDDHSDTPREGDSDLNKNKTVLNIHIVPEGGQFVSRDESLLTSVELSLDGSPPTSANLHPLGYDKNERRKQLKREDAIQSISPPSNNSRLSEEHDSVKDVVINDKKTQMEQTVSVDEHVDSQITIVFSDDNIVSKEIEVEEHSQYKKPESVELKCKTSENSSDESDVITPIKPTEKNSDTNNMKLLHSGEFHDVVLPTKVSRSDTEVVSGE